MRVKWNKYETAMLVDFYIRVVNGEMKRKDAVEKLSKMLRDYAISNGIKIDDIYRNNHGISFQLSHIHDLFCDSDSGLKHTSTMFKDIVTLYKNDKDKFEELLCEAKKVIKMDKSTKDLFLSWLEKQTNLKYSPAIIINTIDCVSQYAVEHNISESFWEIYTAKNYAIVCEKIRSLKIFRFQNKNLAASFEKHSDYYKRFILDNNDYFAEKETIRLEKEKAAKKAAKQAAKEARKKEENSILVYDFVKQDTLAFTKPISISYFDETHLEVSSWKEAVHELLKILYSDYPNVFATLRGKRFRAAKIALIADAIASSQMKNPEEISYGYYFDSNRSANALMSSLKLIIDYCNIDYENIVIKYKNNHNDEAIKQAINAVQQPQQQQEPAVIEKSESLLHQRLYTVSKVYDDPNGLSISTIMKLIKNVASEKIVVNYLDSVDWATKITEGVYSFSRRPNLQQQITVPEIIEQKPPMQIDLAPPEDEKAEFIRVLINRYPNGMLFDSIDFENFREHYEMLFDKKISHTDSQLEKLLMHCGIFYNNRLFPAEGIIDNNTREKLFSYIESKFALGTKVLYYKAIFTDLADVFEYCFSLTDENMLKAYIEFTAESDKYYFHDEYMSTENKVEIDHLAEIEDFILSKGKPVSYDEIYAGLSHISISIIRQEMKNSNNIIMNEKNHYYHIDIFELSDKEKDQIAQIINDKIEEDGYAIWANVFEIIKDKMPIFIENNYYLSSLGIRNVVSRFLNEQFDFSGEVIGYIGSKLSMSDIYRLFAKHHTPFSDEDINNFSKEIDTHIYFSALAEESVRVSKDLFVSKDSVSFDIEATDDAIETYFSGEYALINDVDSFLLFPNVGYEWNIFLLESYLMYYSRRFCLVNNGISLYNVAGAIAKKNGKFTQFVDICANALANSTIELKNSVALDYLAEKKLITRKSYKELDIAITKARQIRNLKG